VKAKSGNPEGDMDGPPETVDGYIASKPEDVREILRRVRETIRAVAPEASEKISYRMPTFWQGENLIHFAAFKNHLGVYPGDLGRLPFAEKLAEYRHSRGAIQFPYDRPIPYGLIAEIAACRVGQAEAKRAAGKGK